MAIDFNQLETGAVVREPRILLYGVEGIGKSTFGAEAPNPIFIRTEDRHDHLGGTKLPLCKSYEDILECFQWIDTQAGKFKTVILDSADWAEQMIGNRIARDAGEQTIGDIGYGAGYKKLPFYWHQILDSLNYLRAKHQMIPIVISHARITKFNDPGNEPYSRYQPDLHDQSGPLLQEWADNIFFANYKTYTQASDGGFNKKLIRGIGSGERVMYTEARPAYVAKNSYRLPQEMPLSWSAFVGAYDEWAKTI